MSKDGFTRRHALTGAATIGLGVPLLAACGNGDSGDAGSPGSATDSPAAGGTSGSSSSALTATSVIPVGGGEVFADQKVVVTQPQKGDFKGFSAVCTHQGCLVATVSDGAIQCPCHGSRFSITDGSVINGPATEPLPAVQLDVKGSKINLA